MLCVQCFWRSFHDNSSYKNGETWDFLATVFKIKSSTFQQIFCKLVDCVAQYTYKTLVTDKRKTFFVDRFEEYEFQFKNSLDTVYAVNVMF